MRLVYVEIKENCPIKNLTSYKIGGNVEKLYFPQNLQEFVYLLKTLNSPLVLGNWSNVLISSGGINGNVISTSKLSKIVIDGTKVFVECGVKGPMLSKIATENELSGFEFMSGFPGSIGGNIYMNASAHSQSISDKLVKITVFDMSKKEELVLDKNVLNYAFSYRSSVLQKKPYILLSAEFNLEKMDKTQIEETVNKNLEFRKAYQPNLTHPNCGSVFRNPEDMSAGKLLEEVGAKNFKVGGAKVWEKHANFIVNSGNATSTDILELMLKMYLAVKEKFNVELKPEVKYFGERTPREEEICNIIYSQK